MIPVKKASGNLIDVLCFESDFIIVGLVKITSEFM